MRVFSYIPYAYKGVLITVEADIRRSIPGMDVTGLPGGAVRESGERVRAAFRNCGFVFPQDRVLINLAPAGVKKDGAGLDLPIALAVMSAASMTPKSLETESVMAIGELELSGAVRGCKGALAAVACGLRAGINLFIVPGENLCEALVLAKDGVCGASSLSEVLEDLHFYAENSAFPKHDENSCAKDKNAQNSARPHFFGDFADVRGEASYKRAMEIAAAGGHNLLAFGPPGCGKTMLARRLPSITAPLTTEEAMEVTKLHSLAGELGVNDGVLIRNAPFRSPHHSASMEGVLGGGKSVRPGEISLSHYGALFLDEAPEFKVNVLQSLREPLEDKVVTISRAEGPVRLPADFQLIMAANPCPCGRLGINSAASGGRGEGGCFCSGSEIDRYWKKFGGALLDRIEIRTPMRSVFTPESRDNMAVENSADIRKRVVKAVELQRERFKLLPEEERPRRNAGISAAKIKDFCPLSANAEAALKKAVEKLKFSGRAYYGTLRVARTIADLDGAQTIETVHILEAVHHRRYGDNPYDVFKAED
ncbi:MAG: YifB family Mg chelatase-like AAA ATPase [Spirochaetaceae bacterium]|nr:YifB family Mg chelatase-like AAA ATPase [Spirochaetaceae bacterium]